MSFGKAMVDLVAQQGSPERRSRARKWMEFVAWNTEEGWTDERHLLVKTEAARIRIQGYRGAEWMRDREINEPTLAEVNEELLRQERIFGESAQPTPAPDVRALAAGE